MCTINRSEVSIGRLEAYKMFCCDWKGRLHSVFHRTYKPDLFYEVNKLVHVDCDGSYFYAFRHLKDGITFLSDVNLIQLWSVVTWDIIILPVTMYNISYTSHFRVPSCDIQCVDTYYDTVEATDIIVHDSEENRMSFYNNMVISFLRNNRCGMSDIMKKSAKKCFPQIWTGKKL